MEPTSTPPSKRRCKERVRVTRACDSCKRKKLRCSGTLPCSLCQRSGAACEFNAGYTRGRLPPIPTLSNGADGGNSVAEPRVERPAEPNAESNGFPQGDRNLNLPSSGNSPEPHQTDMEGHYVGPASGVSFLIRVQKRLDEHVSFPSTTPIFSFGDAPLPKYDPSFLAIPTREEAKMLLDRYFDFAFPTHRFLHQQRVEGWMEEFYRAMQESQAPGPGEREVRGLLLMLFAQAKQSLPESERYTAPSVSSVVYFAASEHHLAAETGAVRLTSVQARLAQCFYLLSQSRINHCWSLFGTTARLAIAIGLHRGRRRELAGGVDCIEQECRKRVFWCMYSLDNYLSAALGRPRIFHDDEIDQELPLIANDAQITLYAILPAPSNAQSIMLAPVYHAKLSKIISGILKDLYGIKRSTLQSQAAAATKYGAELAQWRKELSAFLDLPNVDMLMLTYQRQYTVLNLAFYHAQILLYRPFILKNFAVLAGAPRQRSEQLLGTINQNIQHCLNASMSIAGIVRDLCKNGRLYHIFWFTHYYAFSAIVVLYVHIIQSCSQNGTAEANSAYLAAGEQAQKDLATCGSQSSFAQRYVMVLEELRKEAQKWMERKDGRIVEYPSSARQVPDSNTVGVGGRPSADTIDLPRPLDVVDNPPLQPLALTDVPAVPPGWSGDMGDDPSPEAYIATFTGWGEFDSLALTGLGELGYLFSSGNLQNIES